MPNWAQHQLLMEEQINSGRVLSVFALQLCRVFEGPCLYQVISQTLKDNVSNLPRSQADKRQGARVARIPRIVPSRGVCVCVSVCVCVCVCVGVSVSVCVCV